MNKSDLIQVNINININENNYFIKYSIWIGRQYPKSIKRKFIFFYKFEISGKNLKSKNFPTPPWDKIFSQENLKISF